MSIAVKPLDGPLGCAIEGLESNKPLSDEDFRTLHRAFVEHLAVVISDLDESFDWLIGLGRRFGPLVPHILDQYHHPKTPEMSIITANMENAESRETDMPAGAFWHSDLSYKAEPADAIFLYSTEIPSDGGDTIVANMALAYETLPDATKERIAGRTAIHKYGHGGGKAMTALTPEQEARVPAVEHPVVRVHPVTGERALFISPGYTVRIKDMDESESEDLLAELFEHAAKPEFHYRHQWQRNQLVGVDNRATMHCAVADYSEPRRMLRMIVGCTEEELKAA